MTHCSCDGCSRHQCYNCGNAEWCLKQCCLPATVPHGLNSGGLAQDTAEGTNRPVFPSHTQDKNVVYPACLRTELSCFDYLMFNNEHLQSCKQEALNCSVLMCSLIQACKSRRGGVGLHMRKVSTILQASKHEQNGGISFRQRASRAKHLNTKRALPLHVCSRPF